jgi:microcystin-dependent protein
MVDQYLGEVRTFSFKFAPEGWHLCDGTNLQISGHEALFSVLGTTYGGDGVKTFALPDLRGRAPLHFDAAYLQGQQGGVESVPLVPSQMPAHTHAALASTEPADEADPSEAIWANGEKTAYASAADGQMSANAIAPVGGQAHDNMQPYLVLNLCIAMKGIFPSPNKQGGSHV